LQIAISSVDIKIILENQSHPALPKSIEQGCTLQAQARLRKEEQPSTSFSE
jgi:hypothetical protein